MSQSISAAILERIEFIREELEEPICKENPQYAAWLEETQLPRLTMEFIATGANHQLLKGKKMSLQQLKNAPSGTKMGFPLTVLTWKDYTEGQYGPKAYMTVRDDQGVEDKISYGAGQKVPFYPQQQTRYVFNMSNNHSGGKIYLNGYITAANQNPGAAAAVPTQPAAPPPVQAAPPLTVATGSPPPQQATAPSAPPAQAPVQVPPKSNGGYRGEDPAQFMCKQKCIMVQVAAKIVAELQSAGKQTGETSQAIQFWADAMWAVSRNLGQSVPPFQGNAPTPIGVPEDEIPF